MRSDALKVILGALLVFGIIYAYTQEIPQMQNTLNVDRLFWSAAISGIVLGALLGYTQGRGRKELLERFQIFVAALFLTTMLMPLLLSWTNRVLTFKNPQMEQMELLRLETYVGSRFGLQKELKEQVDGYRAFLLRQDQVVRVQKAENPFPENEKGDWVTLPVYRGLWGFEFVDW